MISTRIDVGTGIKVVANAQRNALVLRRPEIDKKPSKLAHDVLVGLMHPRGEKRNLPQRYTRALLS